MEHDDSVSITDHGRHQRRPAAPSHADRRSDVPRRRDDSNAPRRGARTTWLAAAAAVMVLVGHGAGAHADVLAYDEFDGHRGGTVGWQGDWFYPTSGGALTETAGVGRRYFNAPLSKPKTTVWISITGRLSALPTGTNYAYHVPMGVNAGTSSDQHPGLHFDASSWWGLPGVGSTAPSRTLATATQTWLARYDFGAANASGRFNASVKVWIDADFGQLIDTSAPPATSFTISDTTLDSLYGTVSGPQTLFIERESVATTAVEALGPRREMYFVAHEDDDLLFMNPDISKSIKAQNYVRTVYLTTGAVQGDTTNTAQRENGVKAAYAAMAGVPNTWACATLTLAGKGLWQCTLNNSHVSLVFIRLPSNIMGSEAPITNLWAVPGTSVIDDNTVHNTYTRASIVATYTALMNDFHAGHIRTLDGTGLYDLDGTGVYGYDHLQHQVAGHIAFEAHHAYATPHTYRLYRGYNAECGLANVSPADQADKDAIYRWYAQCDPYTGCNTAQCGVTNAGCTPNNFTQYYQYQYSVSEELPQEVWQIAVLNNLCLTVQGGTDASGSPVVLATCSNAPEQRWTFSDDGTIRGIGGKCLTVHGVNTAVTTVSSIPDGTALELDDCRTAVAVCYSPPDASPHGEQSWRVTGTGPTRNGPLLGLLGKCVEPSGGLMATSGAPVVLDTCQSGLSQYWSFN
jgi:hypothetical protein